ncbi:diguanylate cyclase [Frateuria sp.]|uniref:ligand-binding sensor domain-containing diguanylate cyclase n=1 Tax=Frateuria sp. TaxID=2211372 RepID=UPI003F80DDAE
MNDSNIRGNTARPRLWAWLALLLLCGASPLLAVPAMPATGAALATEAGQPAIRNFTPAEYGGAPQNWSVVQGHDGVIYMGNVDDGLFAFDGSRWQRIPIPNRSAVRSLAVDASGRVYVGAVGDFGYLQPDAGGQMNYVSLLHRVPLAEREFTDVWKILPAADGIWFTTRSRIFRLQDGQLKVWRAREAFHLAFLVRDALYVREIGHALVRLTDDGGEAPVPGGERFAEQKIYVMLPLDGPGAAPGSILIGTYTDGWYVFDGNGYRPWSDEANALFAGKLPYFGLWLRNGLLAVATPPDGLFLLDREGHLVRHLTRASGLADDAVNALYEDREDGLWATSDVGISRIAIDSPLTRFDEHAGLGGAVLTMARHAGRLYVGSTAGLFRLDPGAAGDARFQQIPLGTHSVVWSLLDSGHGLLAATFSGVFQVGEHGAPTLVLRSDTSAFSLLRSRRDPSRVFVGLQAGLASLRWDGQRWVDEGRIEGVHDELRSLYEDADGRLWAGTWNSNVLRLSFPAGWAGTKAGGTPVRVERFNARQGLPAGQPLLVPIDGQLRFATSAGIYRFDEANGRFAADARFAGLFPDGARQVAAARQDHRGRLWMYTADLTRGIKETGRAQRDAHGAWHWSTTRLQPIAGSAMTSIRDDGEGVLWFGAEHGMYRYEPSSGAQVDADFHALLRGVLTTADGRLLPRQGPAAEVPYARNALRFMFAAPSFDTPEANRFQVMLEGLDTGWSPWTDEAYRDYTNLREGDYRFRVRARNVYGAIGKEATFAFRVLPPWYRTGWAWLAWIAAGMLLLVLTLRWRLAALRQRNQELAALVERRTVELKAANEALAEQTITDPLTGLKNRRYLHDHIEQNVALARRHFQERQHPPQALGLLFLMVDIDHFKEINDTYGHAAGDRVLQQFRDILLAVTRESDTPVRWGGEEFLIVARFAPRDAGPQFAERIRAAVASHRFDLGEGRRLHRTCSIGFASYPVFAAEPDQLNWEQVVNLADECLYAAKRHGRNAWAGVAPMDEPLQGNVIEALHASFACMPEPGPLRLIASWAELATA